jgi:hypothetical protein
MSAVVLAWTSTVDEYYEAALALRRIKRGPLVSIGVGAAAWVIGAAMVYLGRHGHVVLVGSGAVAFLMGFPAAAGVLTRYLLRSTLSRSPFLGVPMTVTVGEEGVRISVPMIASEVAWGAYDYWFATPSGVALCLSETRSYRRFRAARIQFLTAHATDSSSWAHAVATVEAHLARHPRSGAARDG